MEREPKPGKSDSLKPQELERAAATRRPTIWEDEPDEPEELEDVVRSVRQSQRTFEAEANQMLAGVVMSLDERVKDRLIEQDESVRQSIDERTKSARTFSLYIGAVVTLLTVLGGGIAWVWDRSVDSRDQLIEAERRKADVDRRLDDSAGDVRSVAEDVEDVQEGIDEHVEDQGRINKVQMLRSERQETMLKLIIKNQGRKVPERSDELVEAEREVGIFELP